MAGYYVIEILGWFLLVCSIFGRVFVTSGGHLLSGWSLFLRLILIALSILIIWWTRRQRAQIRNLRG